MSQVGYVFNKIFVILRWFLQKLHSYELNEFNMVNSKGGKAGLTP